MFCKGFLGVLLFGGCSEMHECGKSGQELASCDYLLVVKLAVKGNGLLLRIFIFQDTLLLLPTLSIFSFSDKLFNTFKAVYSEQDNNPESCFLVTVEFFLIASSIIYSLPPISQLHIGHSFFLSEAP